MQELRPIPNTVERQGVLDAFYAGRELTRRQRDIVRHAAMAMLEHGLPRTWAAAAGVRVGAPPRAAGWDRTGGSRRVPAGLLRRKTDCLLALISAA